MVPTGSIKEKYLLKPERDKAEYLRISNHFKNISNNLDVFLLLFFIYTKKTFKLELNIREITYKINLQNNTSEK